MKYWSIIITLPLVLAATIIVGNALLTAPIDPAALVLPAPFKVAAKLQRGLKTESLGSGIEIPEAITRDPLGDIYLGSADGFIWVIHPYSDKTALKFAKPGGYPIGLASHEGMLYAANYPLGLQSIDAEANVRTLLSEIDGKKIGFADDLVISKAGMIYLTDASTKFNPLTTNEKDPGMLWDFLEARGNGRVIAFNINTGKAQVLLNELYFPSGISLNPDQSKLYVVEIGLNRVIEVDLEQHTKTTLIEGFPGVPDDIFTDEEGQLWISLVSERDPVFDDWLIPRPWLRKLVSRLPGSWLAGTGQIETGGSVLQVSPQGELACQYLIEPSTVLANIHVANNELLIAVLAGDSPLRAMLPAKRVNGVGVKFMKSAHQFGC